VESDKFDFNFEKNWRKYVALSCDTMSPPTARKRSVSLPASSQKSAIGGGLVGMVKESTTRGHPTQRDRFMEAARGLECDESEERFDAALKKIAGRKSPKEREDGSPKGSPKPTKETR
jgi:hypothetical protein